MIQNRKINYIEDVIQHVQEIYLKRCFKITLIHADNELEPLCKEMADLSISLICASKKEHVPDIYQCIQTVK